MALNIFLSPTALFQLEQNLDYILNNWNHKTAVDFLDTFYDCIKKISEFPNAFPLTNKNKNVHRCVISRHQSMYYRVMDNEIEIVFLFDNRQSSAKLKKQLKKIK
jgi:plasmid stabilization system protein ParE